MFALNPFVSAAHYRYSKLGNLSLKNPIIIYSRNIYPKYFKILIKILGFLIIILKNLVLKF